MAHDLGRLYEQGRAKSPSEPWTAEENEAVHMLAQKRGIQRQDAADYVRNGILTLEDFDKAKKADFAPKKLEDVVKAATDGMKDEGKKIKGKPKK